MTKILKQLPSLDRARRYRELEWQAERTAATVPPLYRESFKRVALKWRHLAEEAERGLGRRSHSKRFADLNAELGY